MARSSKNRKKGCREKQDLGEVSQNVTVLMSVVEALGVLESGLDAFL